MTTTTTNAAKKLYKVFAANHDDDVIQDCKTKLNICIEENRIGVWMNVERKTLKSAYNYFHKALEQAVADGALDAKIAQFGEFADDINDINFDGKDSITAFDNIDNSFAYGIDDNTCVDLGYYFWFWVKTDETTAEDNVEVEENTVEKLREKLARLTEKGNKLFRYLHSSDDCKKDRAAFEHEAKLVCSSRFDSAERWQIVNENAARNARLLAAENEYNRIEKECEKLVVAIEAAENTANAEAEQSTAQVEETEEKFIYTTNRGNTREVKVGETGSTTRGMWYYYHEIGGLSEQDVIDLATKQESGEFVNALCKFIVNDTDGSEEDDDEIFSANVMPAEDDDTDDELIDPPDRRTVERNKGNYKITINGEHVTFRNFSIDEIDANDKLNCSYTRDFFTNRRTFYYGRRRTSAAKIIERYMNGEIAAEQSQAISDFFYAHKLELCKPFKVCFEITTADGQEHFFLRTLDKFAEAKALVDEFTSTFSEPTLIVIEQNKQGGDWYYSRDVDGTEKFFDAYCKMNSAAEDKAEEKNYTANCYYTYTKDGDKRNGLESRKFATATEAAIWILNYVRENGYTLVDGTNIRDCTDRKEYFMSESDFNAVNAQIKVTAAEVEPEKKSTAKVDRLDELKVEKSSLISAISHSLENHFIKLDNGEFVNASEAGFTTFGIDSARPEFDKLYFKDGGEYVEVSEKAIDAFHRLEVWFSYNAEAIEAEIAKTKFKFEVGKWYASDETDWNGNPYGTYRVLKRTKKFVTIYDPDIDDWHYIDNYDPDDEIDGEFDCIFRKKIQYDERGEYVDWRDDDGELVTLCAKDETDKPVDDDDPKDEIDDNEDEIDAAEDKVEVESVNDEKPEHTTDDFSAKLAELKVERDTALKAADEKQSVLIKAQAEHETAVEAWRESNYAIDRLYRTEAEKLSAKLLPLNIAAVKVTKQDGYTDYVYTETLVIWHDEGKFVVSGDCSIKKFCTLARYDTPEQVTRVINGLKAAAESETKFTFPTNEELNPPSKDDLRGSLKLAIEIARQKYREYEREGDKAGMRHESELFEICRKAIEELEVA